MSHQRIEIAADVTEITIVRTVSDKPEAVTAEPAAPAAPAAKKPRKSGPRKQQPGESDIQYAARVERYEMKKSKQQPAPAAAAPAAAAPAAAAALPNRTVEGKKSGFSVTLCKCRGDYKTANKQGTYGQPGYVAAVYTPTTDFSKFGIEGALELEAGTALCGTFLRTGVPPLYDANGKKRETKPDEVFDAAVYHTGNSTQHGDWLQLALFDDQTANSGHTKPMTGRPLFKSNQEIVELFTMPCGHCDDGR